MRKKKTNKIIGAWELIEGTNGRAVYEGDTQEQLNKIRDHFTKAGRVFSFKQIAKRRAVQVGKGFTIYTNE